MNLNNIKNELLKDKSEIENLVNEMRDNTLFGDTHKHTSEKYSSSELSSYDNHIGDIGTELYMQDMQNSLTNHEKYKLERVEDAIEKIQNGTYGVCEICKCKIDDERLELIPETNLCISCSKKEEGKNEYINLHNQNLINKPMSFNSKYFTDLTDMNKVGDLED